MTKGLLGPVLILLAGAGLAPGQTTAPPESAPTAQITGAAAAKPALPTEPPGINTHPWNPPVGRANIWPYDEPLRVPTPDCGPVGDFWLVPEYLLWGIKGYHLPTLVTPGTRATVALVGGSDLDQGPFSGGRFVAGTWLNDAHTCGFEAGYFFLGEMTKRLEDASSGGPGSPVLARPFFDVVTGRESALLIAGPGVGPGLVRTSASSALQGAPADLVYQVYCCCPYRIELLAGFRYQDLAEELSIRDAGVIESSAARLRGHRLAVVDQFNTRNVFFGGEVGARAEYTWGHLVAVVSGKLALGSDQETIHLVGTTIDVTRRRPNDLVGGLLVQGSNSGRFHDGEFSAIPELGLQLGYQCNPNVRLFVGYTFLFWTDVARPGNQIDGGINPAQAPALQSAGRFTGPARPAFAAQETDFWAQGLNVGAEIRY